MRLCVCVCLVSNRLCPVIEKWLTLRPTAVPAETRPDSQYRYDSRQTTPCLSEQFSEQMIQRCCLENWFLSVRTSVTLVMRECGLSRLQVYCLSCWISNHINKEQRKQYCDWAVTLMKNATVLIHHLPHRHKLLCTAPVLRIPAGGSGGEKEQLTAQISRSQAWQECSEHHTTVSWEAFLRWNWWIFSFPTPWKPNTFHSSWKGHLHSECIFSISLHVHRSEYTCTDKGKVSSLSKHMCKQHTVAPTWQAQSSEAATGLNTLEMENVWVSWPPMSGSGSRGVVNHMDFGKITALWWS